MDKEELSKRLLKLRAKKQYDQLAMAKEIGIALNTLVKIEKQKEVSQLTYFKVLNYLEEEENNGKSRN